MSTTSERSELLITKCYCCIPLRISCFIVGYLNLIINLCHTIGITIITILFAIYSHGFNYFDFDTPYVLTGLLPNAEIDQSELLKQIGVSMVLLLCTNFAWLFVNAACLIGLHKKKPGPIRVYVGFAAARLLLSLAGFLYLYMTSDLNKGAYLTYGIDIGLGGYFITLYYFYAVTLEQENPENNPEVPNDIALIFSTKIEKQNLVLD